MYMYSGLCEACNTNYHFNLWIKSCSNNCEWVPVVDGKNGGGEARRGRQWQQQRVVVVVGCLGGQKAKHSPLVIPHDSLLFVILLGALEGSHWLELHAKGRTGLPMYLYIKWTDSPVHSKTECQKDWIASIPVYQMNRQSCPFQNWMQKEGLDCQCTCISNEQTVLSIPQLPSTDRLGLSLLPHHLSP